MFYSKLFGKTQRTKGYKQISRPQALLQNGGFIRCLGQGLYSYLPMGFRIIANIQEIIRDELDKLNGQEVRVPLVNPFDIWKRSGRVDLIDRDLIRFTDRTGKKMVLAPSHEEAMVELVRLGLHSYRELPVFLYQFQNKFRDEEKVKGGLVRAKEFIMKDGYSFHRSFSDLNNFFPKVFAAYTNIFKRCGVKVVAAEGGVGYMGGSKAYEFVMPSKNGSDYLIQCSECDYVANKEVARAIKDYITEAPLPMEKVEAPGCHNIRRIARFLKVSISRLAKAMVFKTADGFLMAVVRGDYLVSLEKVFHVTDVPIIRLATEFELEVLGYVPGYLSPLGLGKKMPIVIDNAVAESSNLVFGGNEEGVYYKNVNFGRDYEVDTIADISQVKGSNRCQQCGAPLEEHKVMELGNIFKLDNFYSKNMGLVFQDENGKKVYPSMGSYGIGLGRLLTAIAENNSDEQGLIWPYALAPYKVFLMGIGKSLSVKKMVDEIHGLGPDWILCDDRMESLGVKFKDADLMGIPVKIVVSTDHIQERKVEFSLRKSGERRLVFLDEVSRLIRNIEEENGL